MGSHLNHMIFTVPIFHDGEIVAFSSSMAHWTDVGGTLGGTPRHLLRGPAAADRQDLQARRAGRRTDPSIIRTNVRLPELAMGDFRAQIASIRTGERRFLAMLRKYGCDEVVGGDRRHHGAERGAGRATGARLPRRRLRSRVVHGRRRRRAGQRDSDPRQGHRRRRPDDDRPDRRRAAGSGLLQLRRDGRDVMRRRSPSSA